MPLQILPVINTNAGKNTNPSLKISSSFDPSPPVFLEPDLIDVPSTRILIPSSFEEETSISSKPLLSRNLSLTDSPSNNITTASTYQQRRRRTNSDGHLSSLADSSGRSQLLDGEVGHVASETLVVNGLVLKLLRYLRSHPTELVTFCFVMIFMAVSSKVGNGAGPPYFAMALIVTNCLLGFDVLCGSRTGCRWIMRFLALGCYSLLLLPGFIQVGYYYFSSRQVLRSIVYSDQPRNRLDLYLPKDIDGPKPVVAFVTGGAWIIGYKAWGSLLGQQLSERDIIVACIDYRNFPQGTMSDMVRDASEGISFVCNNIADYGGDPSRIYLMGQSAGAHIAACALVEQAIKETSEGESITWNVSRIKAYLGLSGGYNLLDLVNYFHGRGLYRSIFLRIMEGEQSLGRFSPEVIVQDPSLTNAVSLLPPIVLFHGTADYSIPSESSKNFADTLQRVGVRAESIFYEGKTHTDLFLQDPMRGGKDQMFEDLVAIIHADDIESQARDAVAPPRRRLVPEFMLQLARKVSPF